jgi:hypothetical protein
MYDDLLTAVAAIITAGGKFGSVKCGLERPSAYPSASVWLQKGSSVSGKLDPLEDCIIMVQIQGYADDDVEESYLEMVDLVSSTKRLLHNARLPGKGAQALSVPEFEAMRMEQGGPTIYVLRVQARISPTNFSTT